MFVTLQEVMKGNNDGRSVVKHTFSYQCMQDTSVSILQHTVMVDSALEWRCMAAQFVSYYYASFPCLFFIKWVINCLTSCQFCGCLLGWDNTLLTFYKSMVWMKKKKRAEYYWTCYWRPCALFCTVHFITV